ncbi:jg6180 [Pararge aegeria aegeria]|uniref:Jg6180 protein n=1 Tax=Pararge aegeria aegeria TaxID=348720 RepID=A0A8S4SCT5_9NEOP|nr:jg6180 [Pararge aegeria aegeria]
MISADSLEVGCLSCIAARTQSHPNTPEPAARARAGAGANPTLIAIESCELIIVRANRRRRVPRRSDGGGRCGRRVDYFGVGGARAVRRRVAEGRRRRPASRAPAADVRGSHE